MSRFGSGDDGAAFGQFLKSRTKKQLDEMRTFDVFWQNLTSGRNYLDYGRIMPTLLRDLAPTSAFDPRQAWAAEQEKMMRAAEAGKKKEEEPKKQKKERRKAKDEEGGEEEDGAKGGGGGAGVAAEQVKDPKWREEFLGKLFTTRDQIKAAFDAVDFESERMEEVYEDSLSKVKKLVEESVSAEVKQQKTNLEKKVASLGKDTLKAFKKIAEEETGTGKVSKKDRIREKQDAKRQESGLDKDEEKIMNVLKKAKHTAVTSLMEIKDKVDTPLGRVQWMLAVMGAGLKKGDKVLVLDCYFSLLENAVYKEAKAELLKRKKERKEAKAAASSSSKSKKSEAKEPKETPMSREAALLDRYSEVLDQAKALLKEIDDVIEFQLTEMSNRLPPLSSFTFGRSLDPWQKQVLSLVDQAKSVIVCAPTSAGKTVLSSYITLKAEKILFVVPSEPLVWQVAAMFNKLLAGNVALVTDQIVYNPDRENPRDWRCVVGTPLALESNLSKVRGKIGAEMIGKQDYSALRGGFHEFEYVVYDEVHTLDGEEGAALQRIIRAVRCNFLALSATIGNAEELREWWQTVHDQHVTDELADLEAALARNEDPLTREEGEDWEMLKRATKFGYAEISPQHENLAKVRSRWSFLKQQCLEKQAQDIFVRTPAEQTRVELVDHKARFINLQRWVWAGDRLRTLHPLAAVSLDYLKKEGFDKASLAFTPYDSYKLWESLNESFEDDDIEDLDPDDFFEGERITLEKTRDYEEGLKKKLRTLAVKNEEEMREVISSFAPRSDVSTPAKSSDIVLQMKKDDFFPSLFFRLDTYKCTELFVKMLEEIEAAEKEKYPTWYEDLAKKKEAEEARVAKARAELASKEKRKGKKGKVDEDGNRLDREELEEEDPDSITAEYVDLFQPHPDFTLVSPVNRIPAEEMDGYLEELCGEDAKKRLDYLTRDHPFIRALRRGMGIYVNDAYTGRYRRIVQSLAQQGKLAVVFSDTSLAFGVNMPFRTTVFYGDDPDLLTPLMAAQMSGRAGRRGLDTQGHLVYLGMPFKRIQELMLGCIPAIIGEDPKYPLISLQHAVSKFNNDQLPNPGDIRFVPLLVDERRARGIGMPSLSEYIHAKHKGDLASLEAVPNHYDVSFESMQTLGILREDKSLVLPPGSSAFLWEMREYCAEALALVKLLPFIQSKFLPLVNKWKDITRKKWNQASVDVLEGEFLTLFLAVVDRIPAKPGATPLHEEDFVVNNKLRSTYLSEMEDRLREVQQEVGRVKSEHDRSMLELAFPPSDNPADRAPLDSTLFKLLVMRKTMGSDPTLSSLSSQDKYLLKDRLWKAGSILRQMHNCLQKPGDPYEVIAALLMRKTFARCKYIMRDTFAYTIFSGVGPEGLMQEDEEEDADDDDDGEEEAAAATNGEERKV